jgi:dihydroxyacetone kinase-like protein
MLINTPDTLVSDALDGLACAHPELIRVRRNPDYVIRADAPLRDRVAVVSGGGSGHEPMHIGYVGRGMLTAACPGAIFTSPTPDQILAATHEAVGDAGVLYIIKKLCWRSDEFRDRYRDDHCRGHTGCDGHRGR